MQRVHGHCPMGCGETLFLGAGGHVTCSYLQCPRPTAVDELLDDSETEHLVELGEDTFSIKHPLRERLDGDLFDCALHGQLKASETLRAALKPGRYRARQQEDGEFWLELIEEASGA